MANPATYPPHQQDRGLEEYIELSTQQEALRRRISLRVSSTSPITAISETHTPESYSPFSASPPPGLASTYPAPATLTLAIPTEPGLAHRSSTMQTAADKAEEDRLYEVNHQIKTTLTELLNSPTVKADNKFRAWIQNRLMDAEVELRKQKRRRSSIDREFVERVAESLERSAILSPRF
ncbi:hypothetical protein W97_04706 [Coniosporium apollinis CBS 100218]|uniref:Uncharacterized protein n=1 Tax=Coniosporium apollinis (strain CBS 100218) TaxID=1168221 RepID=R7YUD9_CONA1|nr:uncharacterized protein W97_04706 [Coniosporium apollinis CBS 100218]EON65468.1 hypothetical protein W97_04706 [Coniosporium apollinis CBS 100218]